MGVLVSGRLQADLEDAMAGTSVGMTAADRLCSACVEFLQVDGAAISVLHGGASQARSGRAVS